MHTIQQIIDNQKNFKKEICSFLYNEQKEARIILNKIKSEDNYIKKHKVKLKNRFKKIKYDKYIKNLFFLSNSRSEVFYAWWDTTEQEAKILKYDKK